MTMSGLGFTEWPDKYLAWVPRYGFDSIFTSVYSNPDGSTAPSSQLSWLAACNGDKSAPFRKQDRLTGT